jgi:glycosyltransferase involved in cell wall biosynthesis
MLETEILNGHLDDVQASVLEKGGPNRISKLDVIRHGTYVLPENQQTLAAFCFEDPHSSVGRYVGRLALALAERETAVYVFTRQPLDCHHPYVHTHAVGECGGSTILDQVQEFTRRAGNAFLRQFSGDVSSVTALGCEWSSIPVLSLLYGSKNLAYLLSLHSLERMRSGLTGEIARQIDGIEASGLLEARTVMTHDEVVAKVAAQILPDCVPRLKQAPWVFPVDEFQSQVDPGEVKARYQIGPIDPTILFIGDMDERHGPDVLMKSVAPVLKNHKQARFLFAGEGTLTWPLRVHARYLLLEHAVRLPGSIEGQPLRELIQAADIIAVPSREQTEWWPVLAAWASRRPVLASHEMATGLGLQHGRDSVLIYPNPASCVWGVEYLLSNADNLKALAARGRQRLEQDFGWGRVAAKIEELMGVFTVSRNV